MAPRPTHWPTHRPTHRPTYRARVVRRSLRWATTLLALAATAACVRLPDNGPVVTTNDRPPVQTGGDSEFRPQGPVPGDVPVTIVDKFLVAMTATPVRTEVAGQFLTRDARAAWDPTRQVITYAQRDSLDSTGSVEVQLSGARWVDSYGQWRGKLGDGRKLLRFAVTKENGQWRIARAPDALVVPEDWFDERGFRAASVYYLDPSASILVPEPVFIPRGDQLATYLVQSLMAGPGGRLADIVRTFVPPGLTAGLSVPVDADGIASITLQGDPGQVTPQAAQLMVYQFAWTLKQDPSVTGFRITIGDRPVTVEGGVSQFSVDLGSEFDPTDVQASSQLFAVRNGLLESGNVDGFNPLGGSFGSTVYGIDDVAVSLTATTVAAVTDGGTALRVGSTSEKTTPEVVVRGATDLLRPAWDFADRLWVVDRAADGAHVTTIDLSTGTNKPVEYAPVTIRGISGRDVESFLVSRDGTRLVAVVHGLRADQLVISRIRHDSQGGILSATRARPVAWASGDIRRIRDIGWRSPTTIAVLYQLTKDVTQVAMGPVDGSLGLGTVFSQRRPARSLVSSPVDSQLMYTLSSSGLADPTGTDSEPHPLQAGVTWVHYPG
jgi:hypothetical protein